MNSQLRCEWGEGAVRSLSAKTDVLVIVDVLSFSTCVDVAVSRGARILPYSPSAPGAEEFARKHKAELAVRRGQGRYTLSPAAYLDVAPGTSVVLRSPNGALATLAAKGEIVLAGCLRNASAIAQAAASLGERILVVPAEERWPDGLLRPCIEDWLGAGAILSYLPGELSAEASAAVAAFQALSSDIPGAIRNCLSGQELIGKDHAQDVVLAAEVDGVTEGAGLGPGLGHADQVGGEEILDVRGIGIADTLESSSFDFDYRFDDAALSVLIVRLRKDLGLDGPQSLVMGQAEKFGVGDGFLSVRWICTVRTASFGLHGKASLSGGEPIQMEQQDCVD